jgi:hypothetical protein
MRGCSHGIPNIEPLESRIAPAVFIVTTTADTTDSMHDTGSLRDALAKADAQGGMNTIKFHLPAAAAGSENTITLTNGLLTSKGDVTIIGPGAGKLIINGNAASGVFQFGAAVETKTDHPVTITGLSIMNGNNATYLGGGILSYESLTLKNVVISGNTAPGGGAVSVDGSAAAGTKVSISNSLITKNSATSGYGGLDLDGGDRKYVRIGSRRGSVCVCHHSGNGDNDHWILDQREYGGRRRGSLCVGWEYRRDIEDCDKRDEDCGEHGDEFQGAGRRRTGDWQREHGDHGIND